MCSVRVASCDVCAVAVWRGTASAVLPKRFTPHRIPHQSNFTINTTRSCIAPHHITQSLTAPHTTARHTTQHKHHCCTPLPRKALSSGVADTLCAELGLTPIALAPAKSGQWIGAWEQGRLEFSRKSLSEALSPVGSPPSSSRPRNSYSEWLLVMSTSRRLLPV